VQLASRCTQQPRPTRSESYPVIQGRIVLAIGAAVEGACLYDLIPQCGDTQPCAERSTSICASCSYPQRSAERIKELLKEKMNSGTGWHRPGFLVSRQAISTLQGIYHDVQVSQKPSAKCCRLSTHEVFLPALPCNIKVPRGNSCVSSLCCKNQCTVE
jgi:hypothetical protein